jgi:hypothetical protein
MKISNSNSKTEATTVGGTNPPDHSQPRRFASPLRRGHFWKVTSGKWHVATVSALAIFAAFCLIPLCLAARSGQWSTVRDNHVDAHFYCALCGTHKDLEVHHVTPFSVDSGLELVPSNLVTLCRHCHLEAGHLGNFQRENTNLLAIIGEVGRKLNDLRTNETYGVDTQKAF